MYHVITWTEMGSYTLIIGVLKYFLFWGFCPLCFLSFGAFVLWCFCPLWLFSVRPRDRMTRMLIVHTCIMWSHEQKWSCILIVGVLKYFRASWLLTAHEWGIKWPSMGFNIEQKWDLLIVIGGFVRFDFYPLGLLSYGAFVHFGFSLSTHVIAWRECWFLSPPVSCDHMNRNGIVHLDCWSIKIFSLLGVLSALIFILWGLCPMVLLSIVAFLCPPTWSHDENVDCPHLYHVITWTEMGSYTLIVIILKYFLFWGFCPLWFLSFEAFVLWCFCPFWLFFVHPRDRMTRMLIVHTCIMWSHEQKWDCTP